MKIKTLSTPETVTDGGMSITLTHECEVLNIDPRKGAERRVMKGYLDALGKFRDWGDYSIDYLTPAELAQVTDDTTGGKKAGDYKISDVVAKIQAVKAAKEQPQE